MDIIFIVFCANTEMTHLVMYKWKHVKTTNKHRTCFQMFQGTSCCQYWHYWSATHVQKLFPSTVNVNNYTALHVSPSTRKYAPILICTFLVYYYVYISFLSYTSSNKQWSVPWPVTWFPSVLVHDCINFLSLWNPVEEGWGFFYF